MRYFTLALIALLISVPAVAAGGPDALSIAKRALRLAKEPPKVKQLFTTVATNREDGRYFHVLCPRGWVAVAIAAGAPTQYESVGGRRATAVLPPEPGLGESVSGITVTCLKGEWVEQTDNEPEHGPARVR